MKKILFALAILPLLFVACSSDDDNTGTTDFDYPIETLYGQWRATSMKIGVITLDLTDPTNELIVPPTYITFGEQGTYMSEGIFGEGTGSFSTRGKVIATSIGKHKINFEMTALSAKTAKIRVNAKALGMPKVTGTAESVIIELTKDYKAITDFDYNIEMLYGKWRATSVEGVYDEPIDLTDPVIEQLVKPTYVSFDNKGVYTTEGILGNGTGRYATKDKTIYTLVGEESLDFEMTALSALSAKIELNPQEVEFGIDIPIEIELVTVTLTKQTKK